MRKTIATASLGLLVACGSMATGGGGNGGAGGGASGGSGGGASGGSGGGGSGGGGGTTVEPDSVSGTRIKAKVLTTADGAKGAWGWYDSQLAVDCNFYAAADGQTRCLPLQANVASYFADSGCSTPVGWQSCTGGGTPAYAYAARPSTSGCGLSPYAYHVYSVSGAFTGTLYVGSPGSCSMVQTPPAGYTFYALGGELPATTFVAATITIQ